MLTLGDPIYSFRKDPMERKCRELEADKRIQVSIRGIVNAVLRGWKSPMDMTMACLWVAMQSLVSRDIVPTVTMTYPCSHTQPSSAWAERACSPGSARAGSPPRVRWMPWCRVVDRRWSKFNTGEIRIGLMCQSLEGISGTLLGKARLAVMVLCMYLYHVGVGGARSFPQCRGHAPRCEVGSIGEGLRGRVQLGQARDKDKAQAAV